MPTSGNETIQSVSSSLQDRGTSIDSTTAATMSSNFGRHDTFSLSIDSSTIASVSESRNHSILSYTKLSWLNRIKAINRGFLLFF